MTRRRRGHDGSRLSPSSSSGVRLQDVLDHEGAIWRTGACCSSCVEGRVVRRRHAGRRDRTVWTEACAVRQTTRTARPLARVTRVTGVSIVSGWHVVSVRRRVRVVARRSSQVCLRVSRLEVPRSGGGLRRRRRVTHRWWSVHRVPQVTAGEGGARRRIVVAMSAERGRRRVRCAAVLWYSPVLGTRHTSIGRRRLAHRRRQCTRCASGSVTWPAWLRVPVEVTHGAGWRVGRCV